MISNIKIIIKNIVSSCYRLTINNENRIEKYRKKGMKIGDDCRIYTDNIGSEPYLIEIGDNVTISNDVQFITHDGGIHVLRKDKLKNADLVGKIIVGNNTFVGAKSIIMPGITIGDNVIVGAGSIVTKSVENNVVICGVPAKKIKTIEEYYEDVKDKVIFTKNMPEDQKKIYILKEVENG